jgi:hypothetical protein
MTDTTPDTGTETTETTETGTDTAPDLTAEVEKWKAQARKHEERAKANSTAAKELEALKQQTMSDTEKAIEAARNETRVTVLREVASKLVDAEVRAAAAGRSIDADALLDGLDRTRFLTDEGDVDRDALTEWMDRIAPKSTASDPFAGIDMGQGTRTRSDDPLALNGDPMLKAVTDRLKR